MKWTKDMLEYLSTLKLIGSVEAAQLISDKFGLEVTSSNVKYARKNHRISSGLSGHFKKGDVPFTKGKKWDEFMSKEGQASSLKTAFKKGSKPHNYVPVNTIHVKTDGYLWIKISEPNRWKQYHIYLWEKEYGKVPAGKHVIFKNNDRMDVRLDNLVLLSVAEAAYFKPLKSKVPEIADCGVLIAKLKAKTSAYEQ